jgi:hypothetical protein
MDRSRVFLLDGDIGSEIRYIRHIALSPIVAARLRASGNETTAARSTIQAE